ncbi:MAG: hydrolase [Gammaproteobacteria bacterium]
MTKENRFKPAWWLPGPHAQTLWPHLFRRLPRLKLIPERLELPDGDFVDLCWTERRPGPIVAVFHGLEGCIRSPYATGIMAAIHSKGWRGVFMHCRGCSGEPNRLNRSYHSGDTGDIGYLLQTLRQRHPGTPLAAVGYSLGGNALLKYLGEDENEKYLAVAAAVSVPFILSDSADRLERGVSRFYQYYLLHRLHKKTASKFAGKQSPIALSNLFNLNTFRSFDNEITAPLHGFRNVDDYYNRCSSRQFLKNIHTPVLIINAMDDPFMTPAVIPKPDELSEQVRLELSETGGHVGFISGNVPWHARYWLEERIPEYLQKFIGN